MDDKERFLELLHSWEFSDHLEDSTREALRNCVKLVCYGKGETIIKKDLPGRIFWIISKGKASARVTNNAGQEVIVHTMGPGDFFGEIALLSTRPRTVDVVADEEIELFLLGDEDFDKYLISNKKIAEVLQDFARKRLEISDGIIHGKSEAHEGLMEKLRGLFAKKK